MNLQPGVPIQLASLPAGQYQVVTNTDATETVSYGPTSAVSAGTINPGQSVTIPGTGYYIMGNGPAEVTLTQIAGDVTTGGLRGGQATLAAGTVTVNDATVDANTEIMLTVQAVGGTPGDLALVKNPGTGFTINSSSGTDTSTVGYFLFEAL